VSKIMSDYKIITEKVELFGVTFGLHIAYDPIPPDPESGITGGMHIFDAYIDGNEFPKIEAAYLRHCDEANADPDGDCDGTGQAPRGTVEANPVQQATSQVSPVVGRPLCLGVSTCGGCDSACPAA